MKWHMTQENPQMVVHADMAAVADGSITTAKLADAAVTAGKLKLGSGDASVTVSGTGSNYITVPNYAHVHQFGGSSDTQANHVNIGDNVYSYNNRWGFAGNGSDAVTVYMAWHIHSSSEITLPFWLQIDKNTKEILGGWFQSSHNDMPELLIEPAIGGNNSNEIVCRINISEKLLARIEEEYNINTLNPKYHGVKDLVEIVKEFEIKDIIEDNLTIEKTRLADKSLGKPNHYVKEKITKKVNWVKL